MAQRILGGIYLLLIEPVESKEDLKTNYGITHVVSAVPGPLPPHLDEYLHHQVEITDEETSNLLEHLPDTMKFMDEALFSGSEEKKHTGAVLVHCAQGKSRSVSIIIAYLMYKYNLSYALALHAVTRKVEDAEPNDGFKEQLQIFKNMGCKIDQASPEYRKFLVENSLRMDPSGSNLRTLDLFKEPSAKGPELPNFHLRCKRCRTELASLQDIAKHEVPTADSRQSQFIKRAPNLRRVVSAVNAAEVCSHYFMDEPVSWMREELEKQEIEGKFACPKCQAKVGGYSWRGSRCSCGKWMIPALHLQLAKVDEMVKRA